MGMKLASPNPHTQPMWEEESFSFPLPRLEAYVPRFTYLIQRSFQDNVVFVGPLPMDIPEGSYKFLLPLPGIVLIHACQKPDTVPSKVN